MSRDYIINQHDVNSARTVPGNLSSLNFHLSYHTMSTPTTITQSAQPARRRLLDSFVQYELDGVVYVAPKYLVPALTLEVEKDVNVNEKMIINPGVSRES